MHLDTLSIDVSRETSMRHEAFVGAVAECSPGLPIGSTGGNRERSLDVDARMFERIRVSPVFWACRHVDLPQSDRSSLVTNGRWIATGLGHGHSCRDIRVLHASSRG